VRQPWPHAPAHPPAGAISSHLPTYNADTLERSWSVHDVAPLGVSPRRGPVLSSHVLDVRSRDCPLVAALLTLVAFDRSFVMDMSTTKRCRKHWRPRRATPENAEYALA